MPPLSSPYPQGMSILKKKNPFCLLCFFIPIGNVQTTFNQLDSCIDTFVYFVIIVDSLPSLRVYLLRVLSLYFILRLLCTILLDWEFPKHIIFLVAYKIFLCIRRILAPGSSYIFDATIQDIGKGPHDGACIARWKNETRWYPSDD